MPESTLPSKEIQTAWRKFIGCILMVVIFHGWMRTSTCAAETDSSTVNVPYCGLYCLYGAAQQQQVDFPFEKLLRREYVGCSNGSSLAELTQAAKDLQLHALPVGKLNIGTLAQSPCPVILHVKPGVGATRYSHYVLFLGTQQGKPVIMDPGKPVETWSWEQLAPVWNGAGLAVSRQEINTQAWFASARWELLLVVVGAGVFIGLWRIMDKREPVVESWGRRIWRGMRQATGIGMAGLIVAVLYHFFTPTGFLAQGSAAVGAVQQAELPRFLPKLSRDEVERLVKEGVVLVDARFEADYQAGHIQGSINVPVGSKDEARRNALKGVDKQARVVVYCQSRSCQFAKEVVGQLAGDGFTDLSLYEGGWVEWQEGNQAQKQPVEAHEK